MATQGHTELTKKGTQPEEKEERHEEAAKSSKRAAKAEEEPVDDANDVKRVKIGFGLTKPKDESLKPTINIALKKPAVAAKETTHKPVAVKKSVFGDDDDEDEVEEMPAEARMRMKNIGRDTPTSAGPNSFGKTKQGFCDTKKLFEKKLQKKMEDVSKT